MAELVTALNGSIKAGFGCHLCVLKDGMFCISYQLGHPDAVAYQKQWLELAGQMRTGMNRS